MLRKLSERFRVGLLRFIATWIIPPLPAPPELARLLRAVSDAEARNDCKAIGQARRRLRDYREAGLLIAATRNGFVPNKKVPR